MGDDNQFTRIAESVENTYEWGITPQNDILMRKGLDFLKNTADDFMRPADLRDQRDRLLFAAVLQSTNTLETHRRLAECGEKLMNTTMNKEAI
jgi:hypothetical protein